MPTYTVRASQIPVSRRKLFLGRGFRWTQKHTQRLRDTIRPDVQRYVQPGPLYQWARRKEVVWESTPVLSGVAGLLRSPAWWNPLAPLPSVGGKPALARRRTRRTGGLDGSRRAGRAHPGVGYHPRGQDATG